MALLMERHREVQAWLHEYLQQHANQARNERILQMVLYDGYSNKEAAQLLGISEAVVGTVVRPAREYLQQKLQKRDA
jgi:DNA-directed RNA polymerase specialized sigma24 family protein